MPSPPYALVQMSINGGGQVTGARTGNAGDTIQLSGQSTIGWTSQRWEIFSYPSVGFGAPAGWLTDASGVYYSLAVTPPLITYPASGAWGKLMFRLRINEALTSDAATSTLSDESGCYRVLSPILLLEDIGAGELSQYDSLRSWVGAYKRTLDTIESTVSGRGTANLKRFTTLNNPVGLWNFDSSLLDSSGNGNTLSVDTGTLVYQDFVPGQSCVSFNGSTRLKVASGFVSGLALTGDMTVMFIWLLDNDPTATNNYFYSHANSGETLADNYLYSLTCTQSGGSTPPRNLTWLSEHGAGVDDSFATVAPLSYPSVHSINFFATTRTSNVIQHYCNGKVFGSPSSALTAPAGGTSGRLYIGGDPSSTFSHGLCYGLKICNSALSAAQIKAEYNATMGPAFGAIP